MNINTSKSNLLQVITEGRITLNGDALTLKELAELQQNIVFLCDKAEMYENTLKSCKDVNPLEPTD